MNQVTNEKKDRILKTMAIFGFIAVVVFGVWLAVQVVGFMPQALSSLASIADTVYNTENNVELHVTKQNSVVNSETPFAISWNNVEEDGIYTFLYTCTDGVSVTITDTDGSETDVSCDEKLSLGEEVTHLEMNISSERKRFTDVSYEIGFIGSGSTDQLAASNNIITIVNAAIPFTSSIEEPVTTDASDPKVSEKETEVVTSETTTPEPTTPATPTVIETITFTDPISDPNGFVDLAIEIVAVGQLDSDGNFIQRANIDDDTRGAFQIQVINIGTKTSDDWNLEATLTSGVEYKAPTQNSLKPKEKIVFTLGYDNVGENGIQTIGATAISDEDINDTNNSFIWAVNVVE